MTIGHESSWPFLKRGNRDIALFQFDDGEDVRGGGAVNPTALRLLTTRLDARQSDA